MYKRQARKLGDDFDKAAVLALLTPNAQDVYKRQDKRIDILNALERIGFFPAYGGVKTMQQIMEKSVPGSGLTARRLTSTRKVIGRK